MATVLVDTNVLIYAHDRGEHSKQWQAIQLLKVLQSTGAGCLSVQTLAEFFSVTTRGKDSILEVDQASRQVGEFIQSWPIIDLTAQIVMEAVRGVREHQFAYWDAQIWASARLNQIPLILSEDFSDGSTIEGVRILNPFRPGFDLNRVLE